MNNSIYSDIMSSNRRFIPMKRRIATLLLVLSIATISITACGNKTAPTEPTETSTETEVAESSLESEAEFIEETETEVKDDLGLGETPPYEIVDQGDYPDNRSDHQAAWDDYKENWDDFSVYGTTTKGKVKNDFPYYGDTGYDPYGTILQERTTDKGYTVIYDTNTGKVYYTGMTLPTGSIWEEGSSGSVLFQYVLDNGLNSTYDITYSEMQELLGVYNGD